MHGWPDGISKQNYENHGTIDALVPFLGLKIPQNSNIFKEKYQKRNKHPLTSYKMISGLWMGDVMIFLNKIMNIMEQ